MSVRMSTYQDPPRLLSQYSVFLLILYLIFSEETVMDSLLPAVRGVTTSSGIFGEFSSPYHVVCKRGIRI